MDVILLERIEKLGSIGDVVKVKNGYARNFLLPRGKALRANDSNRKVFEANREKIEATNAERRSAAEVDSKKVDGTRIQLIRQASNTGQLYGSVSARDLAEALEAAGHKIAKHQIVLDRPIKAIGLQEIRIALHPEVSVTISVNIARSPEEAELQAAGKDVMAEMFEKDVAGFIEERDETLEPGEIAPEPAAAEEAAAAETVDEAAADEAPAEEAAAEEAPADETPAAETSEEDESADKA
jgi:large subunit ribosomal protein L9